MPRSRQACLVLRPAKKRFVQCLVIGDGISVVAPQSEAGERLELDEAFDPIRLGLGDIDKGLAVTVDEVRYVVVKIGRAKCDAPENGLLEAGGFKFGLAKKSNAGKLTNNCSREGALKPVP